MDEHGQPRARVAPGSVHQLGPDDWALLREVRLAALLDAPGAFGSTYAHEVAFPEARWRERFGPGRAWFVAGPERGVPVGLAAGCPSRAGLPGRRDLISMWVDPRRRRAGIGAALVEAVVGWAVADGAADVQLWVVDGNDDAARVYARCGFAPTGVRQALPSDPAVQESEWVRPLPGGVPRV